MLLNSSLKKESQRPPKQSCAMAPPWWVHPFWYSILFLLPFFIISIYAVEPHMDKLGQKVNNLTTENILLGVLSIFLFAFGASFLSFVRPKRDGLVILDPLSTNRCLFFMGNLSLICHIIYLTPALLNFPVLMNFILGGDPQAMVAMRQSMEQIPGITSFMSASLPFFSLYAFAKAGIPKGISKWNKKLFALLLVLIFLRSILGSERLAFVEALGSFLIPWISFSWKPSKFRTYFPLIGIFGVYFLFSLGEYFRSWQYYKNYYDDFWTFTYVRFLGYFVTSFNNGCGVLTYYEPLGMPALTAGGFYKLLAIFGADYNPGASLMDGYLRRYATTEFNLASGLYMPYIDYGVIGGSFYLLFFGLLTGLLYRSFILGKPLGILLYSMWFLALLDIMRTWIWGSSRFVPALLVSLAVSIFLVYEKKRTQKNNLMQTKTKAKQP